MLSVVIRIPLGAHLPECGLRLLLGIGVRRRRRGQAAGHALHGEQRRPAWSAAVTLQRHLAHALRPRAPRRRLHV